MRHRFEDQQWLPYPVEMVFAFFANPENLPRLMPAWQKARIEEASFAPPPPRPATSGDFVESGTMAAGAGTRMTISFRPFPLSPIRIPWDAEITEFTWNEHFCDVQHRGPFAFWRHCHRLRSESRIDGQGDFAGGTLLLDSVEYTMPLGIIGEIAQRLVVERQLRSTFAYRHKRTAELLIEMRRKA